MAAGVERIDRRETPPEPALPGSAETRCNIVRVFVGIIGVAVFTQSNDLQAAARTYDDPVAEYAGLKLMRLLSD